MGDKILAKLKDGREIFGVRELEEAFEGVTFTDREGIEVRLTIEQWPTSYPSPGVRRKVYLEPTPKGRKSASYRRRKEELGDDWSTDIGESSIETWGEAMAAMAAKVGAILY